MNGSAVRRVGIVGAGTMGRRIAIACVVHGREVCLYDSNPNASADAVVWIEKRLAEWVEAGRLTSREAAAALTRVRRVDAIEDCAVGADLVVESVPEDLELKRSVLDTLDPHLGGDTIVASNTSSIPGSQFSDVLRRPENLVNANFGHLDHRKVEVMGHAGTATAVVDRMVAFIVELDLVPIRDRAEVFGYATNRIWRAVKREVLFLIDGGFVTAEDVDRAWILDWGTPIGPCGLMDKIGLDVVRDIELSYFRESGDPRDRPPPLLEAMVAEGRLGEKSGRGFYTYPDPAYRRPGWLAASAPPDASGAASNPPPASSADDTASGPPAGP